MIEIDLKRVGVLQNKLKDLNAKGFPFAQRNTINDMAFKTQQTAREAIKRDFINRNTWTARSVRVDRAKGTRDSAVVGSTERYMADQEFGAQGGPTHIPTPAAAGQSNRSKVRTRVVRKRLRINAIPRVDRVRGAGLDAKARNAAAVHAAKANGDKFVYLERGRRKGIYQVFGTKRKPRTRMVQNLSRSVRVVPRHQWLEPSSRSVQQTAPRLYAIRLREQLARLR